MEQEKEQIRALIADDSPLEIEIFMDSVNWEKVGITICGTASNGKKGLEFYHREHPDLVIADIQMPVMSGIEMAEAIRGEEPEAEIIFLSSYKEFSYAKAGMSIGVREYLLKQDLESEETEQILIQCRNRILEQRRKEQEQFSLEPDDFWSVDLNAVSSNWQIVPEKEKEYSVVITTAIRYMKENLKNTQMDINQVAKYVSLSASRFRTVFKEETGVSPSQYLSELRFERACELLKNTTMKTEEIASESGFLNGKYFRKVFHGKYQMTPKEFRERKGK